MKIISIFIILFLNNISLFAGIDTAKFKNRSNLGEQIRSNKSSRLYKSTHAINAVVKKFGKAQLLLSKERERIKTIADGILAYESLNGSNKDNIIKEGIKYENCKKHNINSHSKVNITEYYWKNPTITSHIEVNYKVTSVSSLIEDFQLVII